MIKFQNFNKIIDKIITFFRKFSRKNCLKKCKNFIKNWIQKILVFIKLKNWEIFINYNFYKNIQRKLKKFIIKKKELLEN